MSSDGEGPGQKPKHPVSGTLAGMPPPKEGGSGPARAPLPPPKAPPGGRQHAPSTAPPLRRDGQTPAPQLTGAPAPASGPHAAPAPASGPHAAPASGPPAAPAPAPASGPHAAPAPAPASGPHAMPAPGAGPHAGSHAGPTATSDLFAASGSFGAPAPAQPPAAAPFAPPLQTPPLGFPPSPSGGPHTAPPFAAHAAAQHQPAFMAGPSPATTTQHGVGAFAHQAPAHASPTEEVPGAQFVAFLKLSTRRAFRLRIEPSEVLPTERASLERASPPILDSNLQAFLAWRRSVLFLVAVALVPLSIIGIVDAVAGSMPMPIRLVKLGPALAEGLFCWICWTQLKRWSHWREQRRLLFFGWILFMAMPFLVFLYPLRTVLIDTVGQPLSTITNPLGVVANVGQYQRAVMPFVFAMVAMLQLAPKAISLMPGLIRASLVIKLLFPGSTAPGWLIVIGAPLYALLAYVILIIPYQFTGSGWFIGGVLGLILGQILLARAGFSLAQPLLEDEALKRIKRVRAYYLTVMILSAILIVIALGSLVRQLSMRVTDIITAVMKFETNVLTLTMIGADLVITNLDRARRHTVGKGQIEEQSEVKIATFVSLQAPSTPPPSGPAP
ncbi:MAG TPA: hypothetical protein VNO30_36565 [Kofleriaceae bacterium]|nr:hypothetical protein [Kofleriaceae bacterium]